MRASGWIPELPGTGVGHHDDRGGAVVERTGVAGGHAAALAEDRLELGELLERRLAARAVVLGHGAGAARKLIGTISRLEEPVVLGGNRSLLAAQSESIHLLT